MHVLMEHEEDIEWEGLLKHRLSRGTHVRYIQRYLQYTLGHTSYHVNGHRHQPVVARPSYSPLILILYPTYVQVFTSLARRFGTTPTRVL